MKIKYTLSDYGEDDFYEFEYHGRLDKDHPELLAEKAAEDYFHNKGGWECSWPIKLTITDVGGHSNWQLTTFEVDVENIPMFRAYKVK